MDCGMNIEMGTLEYLKIVQQSKISWAVTLQAPELHPRALGVASQAWAYLTIATIGVFAKPSIGITSEHDFGPFHKQLGRNVKASTL